jgi:hypothetical protein
MKKNKNISNSEFLNNAVVELCTEYDHHTRMDIEWLFDSLDKGTQIKIIEAVRLQQVMIKEYETEFESTSDEDFAIETFQFGITSSMIDRFVALNMPLSQSQKELEELKVIKTA